jgi:hypothetical protein
MEAIYYELWIGGKFEEVVSGILDSEAMAVANTIQICSIMSFKFSD